MRLGVRLYYFKNNEIKLWSNSEKDYNIYNFSKPIIKWYKHNPYAKRISKNWICNDYRIDQQRPMRKVYSEAYLKIVRMTDIEEIYLDNLIKSIEKNIEYPTVYDDGKNIYYEETIICPNCHKQRKPLTSKDYCEYCGFEFKKALKCPECNTLNLKGSSNCSKCDYEFRKKSFINNNEFEVKKMSVNNHKCPICNTNKSRYLNKCHNCGFDFSDKKQCHNCGEWINRDDKYCITCGERLRVFVTCSECGKENNSRNNFCVNCGNKLKTELSESDF